MKYTSVKTKEDIQNDPRVRSIHSEHDGCFSRNKSWWVYLHDGFLWDGECHIIHEDTISACCSELNHNVKQYEI